jgi:hypothetical protein
MTEPLRNRLLLSLGLGTLASSGCGSNCHHPTEVTTVDVDDLLTAMEEPDTGTADAGDSDTDAGDTDTDAVDTGSADTDTSEPAATCPEPSGQVRDALSAMGATSCWGEDIRLVEQVGSDCTYEYTCYVCCGYGRPYLDHAGAPVLAPTAPGRGWDESADPPDISDLSEGERREIGGYWLQNARAEHSSVAGFHRFALDLMAHGAPPELLARVSVAAMQELRHALDAFTLASAYLGQPTGPSPMHVGSQATIARSLAELAAWTARDGAIGETLAAYLAGHALASTTDPAVRRVLETVVRDETEHAELAWATLRWALEVGGDDVRVAVAEVFDRLGEPQPHAVAWSHRLAAHGVPMPERERLEAARCISEVVLPVARALLGSRAAA